MKLESEPVVVGAVGKVKIPPLLRDFQAEGESPAFGLFHEVPFSTAHLPTISAKEPFFVLFHILLVVSWVLINANRVSWIPRFDPYPFSLLGMIVAVEAVVLSSFILMRQNRMAKRGERRDHLNLQVDLIAEKEVTKLLQMVQAICEHMGLKHIAEDKEVEEFSQKTSVETIAQSLEDTLPEA